MYDAQTAEAYEAESEHGLVCGEADLLVATVAGALNGRDLAKGSASILDIGAGTGLLTLPLRRAGYAVIGLEPSPDMIAVGLQRHPELSAADFVVGEAGHEGLFPPASFDAIVSRQVLCHLRDIHHVMAAWRAWLRPGGKLVLVDGLWSAAGWNPVDLAQQPFAAMTSVAPLRLTLEGYGFVVQKAGQFDELNGLRRVGLATSVLRYLVIAGLPRN